MIYIQNQKCMGCGACVDVCPVGAIQLRNKIATINQDKCQQCEACLTVCPERAIVTVLVEEPVAMTPAFDPVLPQPVISQHTHSKASLMPWVGTALAFVGREILPRVAVYLLEAWDNRIQQPASASGLVPTASQNSNLTPGPASNQRGRRHRQRQRGQF